MLINLHLANNSDMNNVTDLKQSAQPRIISANQSELNQNLFNLINQYSLDSSNCR
jgi:hypothetical protein